MPHWTQTPEGRARMSRLIKSAHARKKKARAEGEKGKAGEKADPPRGRAIAKHEINDLARRGAEVRLKEVEAEATRLRMFLGLRMRES